MFFGPAATHRTLRRSLGWKLPQPRQSPGAYRGSPIQLAARGPLWAFIASAQADQFRERRMRRAPLARASGIKLVTGVSRWRSTRRKSISPTTDNRDNRTRATDARRGSQRQCSARTAARHRASDAPPIDRRAERRSCSRRARRARGETGSPQRRGPPFHTNAALAGPAHEGERRRRPRFRTSRYRLRRGAIRPHDGGVDEPGRRTL